MYLLECFSHFHVKFQYCWIMCICTVRNSSCGKVMFLHLSVILLTGGMHGRGCAWQGACMAGGVCFAGGMCIRGMHGGGYACQGPLCGRGACMAGGMYGKGAMHGRGHAWQEGHVCVAGEMATAVDDTHPTGMHSCLYITLRMTLFSLGMTLFSLGMTLFSLGMTLFLLFHVLDTNNTIQNI